MYRDRKVDDIRQKYKDRFDTQRYDMVAAKFQIKRKCRICGKEFMAKTIESWNCSPQCSRIAYKRRKDEEARHKKYEHKCKDCGADFIGTKNTKLCRACITKRMIAGRKNAGSFYDETPEMVDKEIQRIKGVREKIIRYGECPNYNKDFVKCITCPAGSWRYKGCGTLKSAKDTSTNSN